MCAHGMAEQEADREATRDSLLHQVDLDLREVRCYPSGGPELTNCQTPESSSRKIYCLLASCCSARPQARLAALKRKKQKFEIALVDIIADRGKR